ncbi:hypothetical protein EDD11_002565 [Mortierella claussenii]|nr:hypothetical protein EDD11_002565 [Mortierella claussenii]
MPAQRFRSNSTSSIVDSPLSPSHSSNYTVSATDLSIPNTRCDPIHVSLPCPFTRSLDRTLYESNLLSSSPRLSLSPIGGAAGVMKKLLRRRRGNINSTDGAGTLPTSAARPSFVIVGGQGGIASGSTVYDIDAPHALSSSIYQSPVMVALNSPTSPTSPKSPTFSQSMLTRITGRDHRPAPMQISGPIVAPLRGRCHFDSDAQGSMRGSVTLSAALARKAMNRRSLSADSLWAVKGTKADLGRSKGSDDSISTTAGYWKQQESQVKPDDEYSVKAKHLRQQQTRIHGILETELDFYKNSVEFLNTHHNQNYSAENWANRNRRKSSLPLRCQSESSLLSKIHGPSNDVENAKIAGTVLTDHEGLQKDADEDEDIESNPFGPGSCWKDMDQSCSPDFDVDGEYRSLLSSVDIMLVPIISSPTKYFDCPKSRQLVRTYLTGGEREFNEVVEFGFPSNAVIEDRDGKIKDCRFLTLRLTLTPWHARADESKLYGLDVEKHIPLKEMVNKFFSRTSAMMSVSPPRPLLNTPDVKLPLIKERKSSIQETTSSAAHVAALDYDRPDVPSSHGVHPMSILSSTTAGEPDISLIYSNNKSLMNCSPPKLPVKNRGFGPCKDRGFRIIDPAASPLPPSTIRSVRSAEFLDRYPESCTSPPLTPSPTSLHPFGHTQHQQQQQQPRKGSLSSLSLSMSACNALSTNMDNTFMAPPMVPPRRKASSPAIFFIEKDACQPPLQLHSLSHDVSSQSKPKVSSAAPFSTCTKAVATQSQSPTHAHVQSLQANAVLVPKATVSLPIRIPGSNNNGNNTRHQHQHQQTLQSHTDVYNVSDARIPRAPSRGRLDKPDCNMMTMNAATTRATPMPMSTTTSMRHNFDTINPLMTTAIAPALHEFTIQPFPFPLHSNH